jgi:hypothetical protein
MTITQNNAAPGNIAARLVNRCVASVVLSPVTEEIITTPSTFYDSDVLEATGAEAWNRYTFGPQLGANITLESQNTAIAEVDGMVVNQVSSGRTYVKLTEGNVSRYEFVDLRSVGGQTVREFDGFTAGSVAAACSDEVSDLLTAGGGVAYFTTANHTSGSYVRNAACWAADVNLSCVSVAHNIGSGWTRQRACTLITDQHFRTSEHFKPAVGSTVRWVTSGGVPVDRIVAGYSTASAITADSVVGSLTLPTSGITPASVVGSWFEQGISNVGDILRNSYIGGLALWIDQFADVYACQLGLAVSLQQSYRNSGTYQGANYTDVNDKWFADHSAAGPYLTGKSAFVKTPITFDSSAPVFVIIDGAPVLVMTWWTPVSGSPTYAAAGLMNAQIVSANTNGGITAPETVTVAPDPTI